jgi:DNA invertase Pin-like site-specific DNA recombinase
MTWIRDENFKLVTTQKLDDQEEDGDLNKKEEIISLYVSGNYSVEQLSIEFSCNRTWIYQILKKARIRVSRKTKIDYEIVDKLIVDGLSTQMIAERLDCSVGAIRKRKKELNL